MFESGVATAEDIDKAMVLGYGFPMGPLKLTDLVGLDVRLAIVRTPRARDRPAICAAERLARQSGRAANGQEERQGFLFVDVNGACERGHRTGETTMGDVDWGQRGQGTPKPKRRVPLWVWLCGGGCLLAIIAVVAVVVFVASKASHMMNQDEQWAKLEKVLPFDEKPQACASWAPASREHGAGRRRHVADPEPRHALQAQIMKFQRLDGAEQRNRWAAGDLGADAARALGRFACSRWSTDGRRARPCAAVDPLPVVREGCRRAGDTEERSPKARARSPGSPRR